MGAGYWALVHQQLAIWIWQTVATWIACPWRPESLRGSLFKRDANVSSILRYGKHVTAARMFLYVGRNTDNMLIGHFIGASVLGIYQKSYQWAMMPFWQIYLPMNAVVISIFGRLQNDPERYRSYLRTTLVGVFAIVLPTTVLMYVEADNVVAILLGPQWVAAVPLLKMLTIGAFFSTFALVTTWIYMSEGRTHEQLWWALITSLLIMGSVSIGVHWGEMGVATGFTVTSIIITLPSIWCCLRRSPLRASDFWGAVWRSSLSSVVAAIALWLLQQKLSVLPHPAERLILDGILYGVIYVTLWLALPQGWANGSALLKQLRAMRGEPAGP
jgi:PST family polysaccharide transporter